MRNKKIVVLLLLMACITLIQCSSRNNFKTLNVFFDGVPDPDKIEQKSDKTSAALISDSAAMAGQNKTVSKFKLHPPYKEHQCQKCHDSNSMGKLIQPQPALCYACHEPFEKKYAYVHGPVVAGYCTTCHDPHMSENNDLLTRVNEKVCFNCHDSEQLLQNKNHQVENVNACTGCHNPHGGKDRYLAN